MSNRTMRAYDKEFKLNAIRLYQTSEGTYKQIAGDLGVPAATLATWVNENEKKGTDAFPGKGHIKSSEVELVQLRRELAIVKEERDILKKALGIFSVARR